MNVGFSLSQEQKQTISAAQIQTLRLLSMDNFEIQQMMEKEFLENPLLEYEPHKASVSGQSSFTGREISRQEIPGETWSLEKYITSQLNYSKYTKKEWAVIRFLIQNVDDNGFFTMEEAEAAAMNRVPEDMIHRLLVDLKKLEPRGIFAKDLKECLLLQLYAQEMPNPLIKVLVSDHLEALGRGDIRSVAKSLLLPASQIRSALAEISKLNPRPLNGLDTSRTDYVIPDILFFYDTQSKKFQVSLNDDWYADYRISDYYLQMAHKTEDPQLRQYFEQKYTRAKFLVEGIQQRRETLLTIGSFLADLQSDYLLGRGSKVPVTMTEAAAQLGIAVSTVSRAVKGKYVQYPSGCVSFKSLFETPATKQADTPSHSRDTIKNALKLLIQEEDKDAPLSDALLAEKLSAQGISISRRTVTKYRESLGIPNGFNRRQF